MNHLTINVDQGQGQISRHIYGHFAEHLGRCIYEGFWVGEDSEIPNTRGIRNDTVAALKAMGIPNLRYPGGCFADEYHWMDGVGPRSERPSMVNTHWGGETENNHFGTHEFLDLCAMLECEPYLCGNVGSGTVQELQQWVEYTTHPSNGPMSDLRAKNGRVEPWKIKYWGIGNENWGCGGNMRPEYYADLYRQYATYVRHFGDNHVYKIACGPNAQDYEWTEVLMHRAGGFMDGLSLHYYTIFPKWDQKGAATGFNEDAWFGVLSETLKMNELLQRHGAIMDRYDPLKRVGLIVDEWGAWYDVEANTNPNFLWQQNTLRDALVAALNFHMFHAHADRIHMANIAQTINVVQSVILTDGPRMLLTPTYHVFEMYKVHQDATPLPLHADFPIIERENHSVPHLHASASLKDDRVHLSICNLHPNEDMEIAVELRGGEFSNAHARILTGPSIDTHNTFDAPDQIAPHEMEIEAPQNGVLKLNVPAKSVIVVALS